LLPKSLFIILFARNAAGDWSLWERVKVSDVGNAAQNIAV
jgi:hypothetical protein